jgi:hypothetical protein
MIAPHTYNAEETPLSTHIALEPAAGIVGRVCLSPRVLSPQPTEIATPLTIVTGKINE